MDADLEKTKNYQKELQAKNMNDLHIATNQINVVFQEKKEVL